MIEPPEKHREKSIRCGIADYGISIFNAACYLSLTCLFMHSVASLDMVIVPSDPAGRVPR